MRTLTDHIVEGDSANHQLTIEVMDGPGAGGACHSYRVSGFSTSTNSSEDYLVKALGDGTGTILPILFQNGPIKEFGVNGVTQEVFLAIVIDRLRSFQAGPFASEHSAMALGHCEVALAALQNRTKERIARGVEGTHQK